MRSIKHPLDNIKVIDLTSYIAGSYATTLLADLGAHVVKVESPAGDGFRMMAGSFQGWNRGKRGTIVDLTNAAGREAFYRLAREADVVVENYRPGVTRKLGVDYDKLRGIREDIVYCSVTGYGQTGPSVKSPAFDPLMQAQSGSMQAQGGEGYPPVFLRIAITDYAAAMAAASGIVAALVHKARTGEGQYLETSMVNAAVAIQAEEFMSYGGKPMARYLGEMGVESTYRLYRANDGWLFLSCQDDRSWMKAMKALNRTDLGKRYPDESSRRNSDTSISLELEAVFAQRGVTEWVQRLQVAGVRCATSRVMIDFHDDTWAAKSGLTVTTESPDVGPVRQMGAAIKFSETPSVVWGPAPSHGQHTDEVLTELGYSGEDIAELHDTGAVR